MQCFDVIDYLNGLCPPEHAESWDNVGLLVGGNRAISSVYIALDPTDEVIETCAGEGCELLITHHPLIFNGLKNISESDYIGRRVLKLAEDGISYFAMHTNYDVDLMGDLAAERIALRNCGLIDVTDRPYKEQVEAMMETAKVLYDVHAGNAKPFAEEPRNARGHGSVPDLWNE